MNKPVFVSNSKGQAAIEYLMVFGIAMALSTPFIIKAQSSIVDLRTGSNAIEMHNTLNKIESSIETVNAAGPPAKRTFRVEVPANVDSAQMNAESVVYTLQTSSGATQISRTFGVSIEGDIPRDPGQHIISVSAKSDHVKIEVIS